MCDLAREGCTIGEGLELNSWAMPSGAVHVMGASGAVLMHAFMPEFLLCGFAPFMRLQLLGLSDVGPEPLAQHALQCACSHTGDTPVSDMCFSDVDGTSAG